MHVLGLDVSLRLRCRAGLLDRSRLVSPGCRRLPGRLPSADRLPREAYVDTATNDAVGRSQIFSTNQRDHHHHHGRRSLALDHRGQSSRLFIGVKQQASQIPPIDIEVTGTRKHQDAGAKPWTEYIVTISAGGNTWEIRKRYRLFENFHKTVCIIERERERETVM